MHVFTTYNVYSRWPFKSIHALSKHRKHCTFNRRCEQTLSLKWTVHVHIVNYWTIQLLSTICVSNVIVPKCPSMKQLMVPMCTTFMPGLYVHCLVSTIQCGNTRYVISSSCQLYGAIIIKVCSVDVACNVILGFMTKIM